jgi:hypothetical protein
MRHEQPGGTTMGWQNRRRDFLKTTGVVTGAIGLAPTLSAPFASAAFAETKTRTQHGDGHLYMQTNETQNAVIHYLRSASGTLTEVERISTGGSGSGVFRPLYQANGPNAYEAAGGVILTPDRRFLLTTNGIDNSVSSFGLGEEGQLTLLDVKPTGNTATGRTGSPAKSLAYAPSTGTLFVLHAFGPDHLRLMSLGGKGKLTTRPERYSINTPNKTDRVTTMTALSPNEKFLLVGTNFDERPWPKPDGTPKLVGSNAPDPDGVVIFPVGGDGTLGAPSFQDGGGGSPFYIAFLHTRPDTFIIGTAVGDGLVISCPPHSAPRVEWAPWRTSSRQDRSVRPSGVNGAPEYNGIDMTVKDSKMNGPTSTSTRRYCVVPSVRHAMWCAAPTRNWMRSRPTET